MGGMSGKMSNTLKLESQRWTGQRGWKEEELRLFPPNVLHAARDGEASRYAVMAWD